MARAHKQRILIAVIALCLAAIVIYAIFSGSNQFSLTVGGRKIAKDELSFFFDQEKNATYTYYSSTYGVTNFDGPFWKTEFDGKTPLEYARERALTKCYEQNLQMLLAEKMLSQESSFQAIQNAYTEYISSRNSAKDTTAIYYGPSELEFRDFYNYFLSNQKNAVLAAMRANGTVTENEVSLYYTKMRGLLYSIDPAYEFMVISFDEIAEKSDQSSEIEAVRTEVLNGTKVEDLDIKHEGIRIEEYTLNGHSGNFACSFAETTASNLRLVITELRADTTLHGGRAKEPSIREWGVYLDPFVNYDLNLALGCPATSDNSHSACPASAINDGSKDQISRWAAANSTLPIWVDIDLGTVKTFDTLILTENIVPQWASARIASFDLQIWDGNDYRTVFTYDGIVGENHTFSFEAISAQNVRLLITGLRADTTKNGNQATDPSIRELELYYRNVSKPINIALSKPATASNSHPACPVSDINDGNPSESSRWAASDSTLPAWVEIDLGTPTRVNTLVLSENIVPEWATARISEFALQKWNGSAFETVFTFQGTIGDEHIFKFDTIESEKVRILISALRPDTSINSAGQTDPSLTEIELYCY